MSRFFVQPEDIEGDLVTIYEEDANHIKNVLRLNEGDMITVCALNSIDYKCKIEAIRKDSVKASVVSQEKNLNETNIKVTLFQALPKSDKMEFIIQKAVELGVHRIVPISTNRTIVKVSSRSEKKLERWNKISEAAAKQSKRGFIPSIGKVVALEEAIKESKNFDLNIMAYELEKDNKIKGILSGFEGKSVSIFIGPEGGFSQTEVKQATDYGIKPVTLGRRVLRTETAGLIALSITMYEKEEI